MVRRALIVLLLLAGAAGAETGELPALFDVRGVAADDVLNIRAQPRASAEILGTLAPEAEGVEVVDAADGWGQVNAGERAGWVAMRFLVRQTGQEGLPEALACQGTEPFWILRTGAAPAFVTPEREIAVDAPEILRSRNRTDRYGVLAETAAGPLRAIVARETCGDGMSDRAFGFGIDMIFGGKVYSGCCSIGD
ncbi:Bacterial SH3 domain protein [Jannaschia seosinensis]|uniref:Bacterial SH3 domain protein n=1 Tax=Jannaschia seosinensis TaxID=313367 RepID=A0A0M7BES7_9RHOB|nr:SH3 domain-containing protein [Jannaschia seosinensis]CUH39875.1 Bacterial SH3 domain protein [Jannaschia seosinensis]